MKKFIRLLLSFLSVLLFFSCSNNLKSSSLVISFNLQNQKNQNLQRAATYSENSYVTVIMYDVENMEDQIEDIPDFKIIQKQTVPVKNNSARITFNDITVGTKSIIKAQISCLGKILYEGQSQIFVVSEGKNSITINLNDPQNSRDLSYDADDGFLEIYTERGLKTFRDIVHGALTEDIIVSDDVVYLANRPYPSVNAKLCSDIELTEKWVRIGSLANLYQGTFDGGGKCVTNLNIYSTTSTDLGFFGYVQDATIKNLYVEGNISSPSDNTNYAVGGIVGYAKSTEGNFVTISNCINNVEIDSQSTFVGGILGNLDSSSEIKIESCVNIADITAPYPSGILNTSGKSTITNCLNLGNLTSNSTNNKRTAGICMTDSVNCKVSYCINTGKITLSDALNNSVYPILRYTNSVPENPMCSECYYDSNILPTVTFVPGVLGKTSSDLDGLLPLDGWYNTVSDSQYPIPSTIQEAFENKSSCWEIILQVAKITEATSGYVERAYFVNGDDGDDGNDGSSIDTPKRNLTNVITSLKGSTENPTRTIYIDGELTAESQGVTESPKKTLVTITDKEFGESNKITLIGINNATINAQSRGRFIETDENFYMKMQNLTIKNGWTSSSGGALFFYKSSLELDGCVIKDCFSENNAIEGTDGIYMSASGSVLKMTNTTCEDSIYLYATTATIGSNCTIGTNNNEATDGFITLDSSTLILDGENIVINKPIYINNQNARIELRSNFEPTGIIQIKINSDLVNGFTLFETPRANLLDLFELVDSDGFILTEEGKIEK